MHPPKQTKNLTLEFALCFRYLRRKKMESDGSFISTFLSAVVSRHDHATTGMTPFSSFVSDSVGAGKQGQIDAKRPVRSLDQLMSQAAGLQCFLDAKAKVNPSPRIIT